MIKQILFLFALALSYAAAFAPMATTPPPTVAVQQLPPQLHQQQHQQQQHQSALSPQLNQGVHSYLQGEQSSVTLSLKERHVPTPEEIAAKKRNFNFWCVPLLHDSVWLDP